MRCGMCRVDAARWNSRPVPKTIFRASPCGKLTCMYVFPCLHETVKTGKGSRRAEGDRFFGDAFNPRRSNSGTDDHDRRESGGHAHGLSETPKYVRGVAILGVKESGHFVYISSLTQTVWGFVSLQLTRFARSSGAHFFRMIWSKV